MSLRCPTCPSVMWQHRRTLLLCSLYHRGGGEIISLKQRVTTLENQNREINECLGGIEISVKNTQKDIQSLLNKKLVNVLIKSKTPLVKTTETQYSSFPTCSLILTSTFSAIAKRRKC